MSGVPYIFGNATTSIPLSQLDVNFATNATIGTTSVGLGNTTTTLVGLTNVSTTVINTSNVSANTSLLLQTNGTTTAITVDTSQNVGVGVTPSTWSSGKAIEIGFVGNGVFGLANNNFLITQNAYYNSGFKYASGSSLPSSYYQQTNGTHTWGIAGSGTAGNAITYTTAMSLDNGGNLLVGTTSTQAFSKFLVSIIPGTTTGYATLPTTATGYTAATFLNSVAAGIGSITTTTVATLFNTTSDYRLKENVTPIQNALATVNNLNPVSFTWKNGYKDDGFLAHEIQAVIPNCVTGEKDAVNEDGTPKYQQMDSSGVIPFLVKAIQELKAEFDAYKEAHP